MPELQQQKTQIQWCIILAKELEVAGDPTTYMVVP